MSTQSWAPEDSIRHFMYEAIYATLSARQWENRPQVVLDFGSRWFGDEDGGWRTHMRTMLKTLLGKENVLHTLATYPEYNVEAMPQVQSNSWDFVIADQLLEHVQRPWLSADEIHRVCKRGGIAVVATPGLYPVHPSPLDCWRIMPDGYKVLFPETKWETLTLDMWGSSERVGYEYLHNGAYPYGPPVCSTEEAMQQPYYTPGNDRRCPLMLWWCGRKR